MQKLFKFFIVIFTLLTLVSPVFAGDFDGVRDSKYGLNQTVTGDVAEALNKDEIDQSGPSVFLASQTGRVIGVILSFLGIVFLILVIFGGIQWMTSSGNQEQVAKARKLIISAVIGLVIVFAAYAITSYVGQVFTSN